ncbi:MAG: bacteriohemerythrin [Hahellaceae bacterium]|nr:bacteriohemerythrin [Hahellaceae bacterium]MCP5168893.1 bacteriohemerythrin [Hahellaceae bacterium]
MQMTKSLKALGLAFLLLTLITAVFLGFTLGLTHPMPWVAIAMLIGVVYINKKAVDNSFLVWRDEYSVGIASIDAEHKKLLNLINQLQTASLYYTGEDFDKDALNEVIEYTKYHFANEEKLMETHGYPTCESHKQEHRRMAEKVMSMVKAYEEDSDKTIDELLNFLKQWLIRHINGTDKEYSEFLRSKGVK